MCRTHSCHRGVERVPSSQRARGFELIVDRVFSLHWIVELLLTHYCVIVRVLMSFGEERLGQAPAQRKASGEGRRSVLGRHSFSIMMYKCHLHILPVTARACAEDSTRLVDAGLDTPFARRTRTSGVRAPAVVHFFLTKFLTVSSFGLRRILVTVSDCRGKGHSHCNTRLDTALTVGSISPSHIRLRRYGRAGDNCRVIWPIRSCASVSLRCVANNELQPQSA